MSDDLRASLERDPEFHWWNGWLKVPALAAIRMADDEAAIGGLETAEDDMDEAELAQLLEAESLINQMMQALTDPEALAEMTKEIRPDLDLDAPIAGSDKTTRDLLKETADLAKRAETDEEDEELDTEDRLRDARDKVEQSHREQGDLPLTVDVQEEDDATLDAGKQREPTAAQLAAAEYLRANEARLLPAILGAIAAYCNEVRLHYSVGWTMFGGAAEFERIMPSDMTAEQARKRVEFQGVTVERRERDGLAYIRLDGSCAWDDEHGIGVTLHRHRIVGVGPASEPVADDV